MLSGGTKCDVPFLNVAIDKLHELRQSNRIKPPIRLPMLKWVPRSLIKYSDHLCKLAYTRKISTWQHSNILDWLSDLDPGALICTFDGSFKSKLNLGSWGYTIKWQKRGQRSRTLLERAESSQHIGDSFVAETHAAYNLISDLFVMFQHIQFDV